MTIIVEDGSIVVGAETYASVAFADSYFTKRSNTTWPDLDTDVKEGALRNSCRYLDQAYSWIGQRRAIQQPLQWPRYLTNTLRSVGIDLNQLVVGYDTVPQLLKEAQCELALLSLDGPLVPSIDRDGMIKRAKVGSLEVEYEQGAPGRKTYRYIDLLVKDIITGSNTSNLFMDAYRG